MRGGQSEKQDIRGLCNAFPAWVELIQSDEFLNILTLSNNTPNPITCPGHQSGGTHESHNGERPLLPSDYNDHPITGFYR